MADDELWSYKAGPWGAQVRAVEGTKGGDIILKRTADDGSGYRRLNLGFGVRDSDGELDQVRVAQAKAKAEQATARLQDNEEPKEPEESEDEEPVTLGRLVDAYREKRLGQLSNQRQRRMDRQLTGLINRFGRDLSLERPVGDEWSAWMEEREKGLIDARGRPTKDPKDHLVKETTAAGALRTIRRACEWALTHRPYLQTNPTQGLNLPERGNQRRDRYKEPEIDALIEAARGHTAGRRHQDPRPTGLAQMIILAADTGHRISAILGLERRDWNPDDTLFGSITWRAELDKVSNQHTVPVTRRVRDAVESQLERWAEREYLFPAPARDGHVRTDVASEWLRDLEDAAEGVEHKRGRLWHGFRRQWVTRKKGRYPRSDIAEAGGWESEATLDRYEQPDEETTLDVVLERERGMEEAG